MPKIYKLTTVKNAMDLRTRLSPNTVTRHQTHLSHVSKTIKPSTTA